METKNLGPRGSSAGRLGSAFSGVDGSNSHARAIHPLTQAVPHRSEPSASKGADRTPRRALSTRPLFQRPESHPLCTEENCKLSAFAQTPAGDRAVRLVRLGRQSNGRPPSTLGDAEDRATKSALLLCKLHFRKTRHFECPALGTVKVRIGGPSPAGVAQPCCSSWNSFRNSTLLSGVFNSAL